MYCGVYGENNLEYCMLLSSIWKMGNQNAEDMCSSTWDYCTRWHIKTVDSVYK